MTAAVDTATQAPAAPRPRRRPSLVRLPSVDPPFDDEIDHPGVASEPASDIPFWIRFRRASVADDGLGAGTASTVVADPDVPCWSEESDIGVLRTGSAALPPVRRAASVFARALVEVLSGRRPAGQLRIHCSADIFEALCRRPPIPSVALPHLVSVRLCEPADGVAEVCAVFRRSDRVRAIAFRLAGVDGRWRVTALEVG